MRSIVNIADKLPKHLFWDVDYKKLDVQADKDFIIPRALFATTKMTFEKDIAILEELYPHNQILNELQHTRERISNEVCILIARRYHAKRFLRFK